MSNAEKDVNQLYQEIAQLKNKLVLKDEDLNLAGNLGNQLLKKNSDLLAETEVLQQEKHSLQLSLDAKIQTVINQATEIDLQKAAYDKLAEEFEYFRKERSQSSRKLQDSLHDNNELKSCIEELQQQKVIHEKQMRSLKEEINDLQNNLQTSMNETNSEEFCKLLTDLQQCQKEKKEVLASKMELQEELEEAKTFKEKITELIDSLRQEIQEKEDEIKSYSHIVEKNKEETHELMAEIEMLKFQQVDVNRRGNSIFGEVDDRRKSAEKAFIVLKDKYATLKKNFDIKHTELINHKNQIELLLSMVTKKTDRNYIQELENSLCDARAEIRLLSIQLSEEARQKNRRENMSPRMNMENIYDGYDYLKILLEQSREKVKKLEQQLQSQRMLTISEGNKAIEMRNQLYHTEISIGELRSQIIKLKIEKEVMTGPKIEVIPQVKTEVIPGFQKKSVSDQASVENVTMDEPPATSIPIENEDDKENLDMAQTATTKIEDTKAVLKLNVLKKQVSFHTSEVKDSPKVKEKPRRKRIGIDLSVPTINMASEPSACAQQ